MATSPSSPALPSPTAKGATWRWAASPTALARAMPLPDSPGDGRALDDALDTFAWDLDARDDLHATARYRRDLVRLLGRLTIEQAVRCRS